MCSNASATPTSSREIGHAQIFAGAAASRCSGPAATARAGGRFPQIDPSPGADHRLVDRVPGPCPQTDPSPETDLHPEPIDPALGPCPQIDPSPETDLHSEPIDRAPETGRPPAPIAQPHGAGQPRRGSPADHSAEAGRVWGAEAGALLAALEAEACEEVDAGADAAAEGALMLP